jgi:xanthine dehydrogenase/oxidase
MDVYVDAGMDITDTLGALYMGMNWADNAYHFPNYLAQAKVCFTNTAPRTSMRAPGVVQCCLATEVIVERVAHECGLPTHLVQEKNFIKNGDTTIVGQTIAECTLPTVWSTLLQRSRYEERLSHVQNYNSSNLWRKRGISICPVRYGMGWAGYNAGIRVGVSQGDGTVTISHSGCEIGQGINTKVAQTVAGALGIDLTLVRVTSTSTEKISNGGMTGGSATSEVTCQAAINACAELNARLAPYRTTTTTGSVSKSTTDDWVTLLGSLPSEVSLNTEGWYSPSSEPNGQSFQYFVYGAAVTEIEQDILTGEVHVLASEVTYGKAVMII